MANKTYYVDAYWHTDKPVWGAIISDEADVVYYDIRFTMKEDGVVEMTTTSLSEEDRDEYYGMVSLDPNYGRELPGQIVGGKYTENGSSTELSNWLFEYSQETGRFADMANSWAFL